VNFLVYVPEVEKHETLPLQLTYKLVELEFNIVPEIEGYDRSDWLTFINPVSSGKPAGFVVNLGSPTVPLPLRAFPPMPTLLDHHADAPQSASGLDDAVHWKYRLRLRHQSARQDEILLQVEFNRRPLIEDFAVAPDDDLFAQLAQYTAVAAPLLSILSDLKDWKKVLDRTRVIAALTTYDTLARNVSDAWHRHWSTVPQLSPRDSATSGETDPGDTAPVFESYAFTMTLQTEATSQYYRGLKLLRTAKGGEVGWPGITCYTADGIPHELKPGSDCGCLPTEDCRCYVFDDGDRVPSFSLLTYELTFPSLHIASYQNALTTVWVTRNAELFQAAQPATTPAFVYQTPKASYAKPVVPFIAVSDRLDIGKWSYDPATCPLTRMFGTIFDDSFDNRVITCGVRYGYQLAAGPPPLESYLPVKQSASMPYVSSMVGDIASALSAWAQREVPTVTGGRWMFWITLYSTVDSGLERPVLQLKRLVSPLD
jgi:hypothetical protein